MPSPLAQDLLLLAKGHYGLINDRTSMTYLIAVIGQHILVDLDVTTNTQGELASRHTREIVFHHLLAALLEYQGPVSVGSHLAKATRQYFIHGQFKDGIASLFGQLSNLWMNDGTHVIVTLPETNPETCAKINEVRAEIGA